MKAKFNSVIIATLACAFTALAFLVAACGPNNEDSVDRSSAAERQRDEARSATADSRDAAERQLDEARGAAVETSNRLYDYSFAQKERFVESMERELSDIRDSLNAFSDKIEGASQSVRAEAEPKLQTMRERTSQLEAQLDRVKNASASTWDSMKAATREAYEEVESSFKEARDWMGDKFD